MKPLRISIPFIVAVSILGCRHERLCQVDVLDGYLARQDLEKEISRAVYNRYDTNAVTRVYQHYKKNSMDKGRCCLWLFLSAACGDAQSRFEVTALVRKDNLFPTKAASLIKGVCYDDNERETGLCALAIRVTNVLENNGSGLTGEALINLVTQDIGPDASWVQSPPHGFYMSQECLKDAEWRAVASGNVELARRVYCYYALFACDAKRAQLWKLIETALLLGPEDDPREKSTSDYVADDLKSIQFNDSEIKWFANEIRDVAVKEIQNSHGGARNLIPSVREALEMISRFLCGRNLRDEGGSIETR